MGAIIVRVLYESHRRVRSAAVRITFFGDTRLDIVAQWFRLYELTTVIIAAHNDQNDDE
jgi:hypothetical protein